VKTVARLCLQLFADAKNLKLLIAKLRRMRFGRSSEKLDRPDRATGTAAGELEESEPKNARARNIGSGKGGGTPGAAATAGTSTA